MTIVTKGSTECSPRENTPQRPIKRVGKVCTDKGTVNQCNQGFKEKFKQLWNRAFASLISVNGKHSDDGTGMITLNADDILIAGSGIAIVDNVISTTGETSIVWGAITGDITDQADLRDLFNDIDNRFAAVEVEIPSLLKNAEAGVTSASQYFSRKLIFTKQDGSTFDERTGPNFNHTLGNGDDASKLEAMSRYGIKNAVFDPLQNQINNKADSSALTNHINDTSNPHVVTKAQVGLENVNNTSDLNKPISTATQTALNAKQNTLTPGPGISIVGDVISSTASAPEWGDIIGNIDDQTDLQNALASVLQRAYPVGSVYINASNSAKPSTLLGFGTWVSLGAGRCLMGVDTSQTEFNTVGKTGGEKTHTLTTDEMPSHTHGVNISTSSNGTSTGKVKPLVIDDGGGSDTNYTVSGNCSVPGGRHNGACSTGSNNHWIELQITVPNHTHSVIGNTGSSGGNGAHNNLAPYITVYMWKRTA